MSAPPDDEKPGKDDAANVIPAFHFGGTGSVMRARRERSMGAILLDAGRITLDDVDRISRLQTEKGLRFGDAGIALGVLTQADIDFALAQQFEYPYLVRGETSVSESLLAAFDPSRPEIEPLRALRSQLMLRWFDSDPARRALAVISAGAQDGRSFLVANLAVVFAQLGQRTVIVDGDLRKPAQHQLFGVDNRFGLSAALSGRAGLDAVQSIPGLRKLHVLPAGTPPPNPLELLTRPAFADLLSELCGGFDVVLLDSPPAASTADAQILAMRAAAALILTRKNASRTWRVQGVSSRLLEAKTTIIGAVLNDF